MVKPSAAALADLLRDQRDAELTYRHVGATAARLPHGYCHGRQAVQLGHGADVFAKACEGLRGWRAHARAGVEVHPREAAVGEGLTVVLAARVARLYLTVACRVVWVIDERKRFGFAYGTLPHHVIEGEEAFVVERDDSDVVRFRMTAFTRPRGRATSAFAPLVHAVDQHIARRYLRGLRDHVAEPA